MSLSPMDDYPIHQIAEPIRRVGTSDRNFYDRYYFNVHNCSDELFLVFGMGQYPNLGVADAFAVVSYGGVHRVVRASRELGLDRMDTRIGPFSVEVIEGLRRLRIRCEPNEWDLDFDLTWEGAIPAHQENRHHHRQFERVTFDTMRLAQTGCWSGSVHIGDTSHTATPDRWWGSRDRSWGVRPVGEAEAPGIRASQAPPGFFWIYAPMQFADFSILAIAQEETDGTRVLEQAERVYPDATGRPAERLGTLQHRLEFAPGTRHVSKAELRFADAGGGETVVAVEPLLPLHLTVGTGYGLEPDWRHGMYQGRLKVQGLTHDTSQPPIAGPLPFLVDNLARFHVGGQVGYGLFEVAVIGPHDGYGFAGWDDVAG